MPWLVPISTPLHPTCPSCAGSGALYYLMLSAASASMASEDSRSVRSPLAWARAMLAGAHAVSEYGGAVEGDRTMLGEQCRVQHAE